MNRWSIIGVVAALTAGPLWAHEGHGQTEGHSVPHYLVEPEHAWLLMAALAFVIVIGVFRLRVRLRERKWF